MNRQLLHTARLSYKSCDLAKKSQTIHSHRLYLGNRVTTTMSVIWPLFAFETFVLLLLCATDWKFRVPLNNVFRCLVLFLWSTLLFHTIMYGQLLWHPSSKLTNWTVTDGLIECVNFEYPLEAWRQIQNCLHTVNIYHVPKSGLPLMTTIPIAFVSHVFPTEIFVAEPQFSTLTAVERALVYIHECSHLALHTKDYAYLGQLHFKYLTYEEHLNNADSYVSLILKHCSTGEYDYSTI